MPKLNSGNVITLCIVLVSVAIAFQTLKGDVQAVDKRVDTAEAKSAAADKAIRDGIKSDVDDIKADIDGIVPAIVELQGSVRELTTAIKYLHEDP